VGLRPLQRRIIVPNKLFLLIYLVLLVGLSCNASTDFNSDKVVNFLDYAGLAAAWLTDSKGLALAVKQRKD
jgi:hypothetical protein